MGLERRADISRSSEAGDYQRHWEIRTTWPLVFTLKSREECVEPISAAAPRGHDLRRGQAAGTELVTSVCRLHLSPAITILNEVHFEEKAERLCNKLLTSFPQKKKKSLWMVRQQQPLLYPTLTASGGQRLLYTFIITAAEDVVCRWIKEVT